MSCLLTPGLQVCGREGDIVKNAYCPRGKQEEAWCTVSFEMRQSLFLTGLQDSETLCAL